MDQSHKSPLAWIWHEGALASPGNSNTCRCDIAPFASLVWEGYMGAQVRHNSPPAGSMDLPLWMMPQAIRSCVV